MISPQRRVLAEKNKNAPVNIQITNSKKLSTSPPPQSQVHVPRPQDTMRSSSSPTSGNKRKIEEVEDAERVEPEMHADVTESQRTESLSDSGDDEAQQNTGSMSAPAQTSYDTAGTSFSASQATLEPQFELPQDEMSQRTLDKLNDVPMPQNTSQLPPMRPGLYKDVSGGSAVLLNYINLEEPSSTQGSEGMLQMTETDNKSTNKTSVENKAPDQTEAAARKRMLDDKASELRTRLQLALYKVETRQTSQPFSRLRKPKPSRDRSSSPIPYQAQNAQSRFLSSSTLAPPSSARTLAAHQETNTSTDSAEAHIAAMRARATSQPKPHVRDLISLPMPQLDPSLLAADLSSAQDNKHLPSSPPLSREGSTASDAELLSGLREAVELENQKEQQMRSPPVSEDRHNSLVQTVSQGEAASGLVQLLTAGQGI